MSKRIELPLVVSCQGCGLCCETQAGLPITYHRVFGTIATLPAHLQDDVQTTYQRWLNSGHWQGPADGSPCVWYDQDAHCCRHYEHRPDICREFEVGGAACLRYRAGQNATVL